MGAELDLDRYVGKVRREKQSQRALIRSSHAPQIEMTKEQGKPRESVDSLEGRGMNKKRKNPAPLSCKSRLVVNIK